MEQFITDCELKYYQLLFDPFQVGFIVLAFSLWNWCFTGIQFLVDENCIPGIVFIICIINICCNPVGGNLSGVVLHLCSFAHNSTAFRPFILQTLQLKKMYPPAPYNWRDTQRRKLRSEETCFIYESVTKMHDVGTQFKLSTLRRLYHGNLWLCCAAHSVGVPF